jgi:hypothetical protein
MWLGRVNGYQIPDTARCIFASRSVKAAHAMFRIMLRRLAAKASS